MTDIGIMVYGYDESEATNLQQHLEHLMDTQITIISGSDRENDIIESIISEDTAGVFRNGSPKVMMFLGFSDASINRVLDEFKNFSDVNRPIFCGLTENNVKWPLKQLIDHLIEEQRYWA